jgi:hypothetical protein
MGAKVESKNKPLMSVTVWQKITYLVRCDPDEAATAVKDPVRRLGKVGEGEIYNGEVKRVAVPTMEELEAANPTMPGVKV